MAALLLFFLRFILRMPRYRQAALGWCIVKVTVAMASFLILLAGGVVGFFRGQPDAIHLTLLALIWFPSVEFMPSLVDGQRFITIGRIVVSIPIVVLGSRAGNWVAVIERTLILPRFARADARC